jgi:gliding motility-associated lipoprotein GldK
MIKSCFFSRINCILAFALLTALLQGCIFGGKGKGNEGELIGVQGREGWKQELPYGMVSVPPGTFHMGQADQDVASSKIAMNKQITISGFYMDDTEITNNEYRQFLQGVDGQGKGAAAEFFPLGGDSSIFVKYRRILPLIEDEEDVKQYLYPDTLVWMEDFTYHMGDPMTQYYFGHPAYDEYPVVGVTWSASLLFCEWRTKYMNAAREADGKWPMPNFRLPSEAEWEYAARGGRDMAKYPWGGPYARNAKGCALANFKPGRGNYYDDGFSYAGPVASYFANDYGLYDMAGNAAEWCEDAFNPASVPLVWDLNPVHHVAENPRKLIRGGSWKDIAFLIETGSRTFEHQDSARSFVGFRCAMTYLGRSSGFEF